MYSEHELDIMAQFQNSHTNEYAKKRLVHDKGNQYYVKKKKMIT